MFEYIIIICDNVEFAMKINSLLNNEYIENTFMSLPSVLGQGCGLSIRVAPENFDNAKKCIDVNLEKKGYKYYKALKQENDKLVYQIVEDNT